MNKYHVYLADNYSKSVPFTTDWNYELLGDKLRAEFEEWFAHKVNEAKPSDGKPSNMFKGEYIKRFMISKKINLVDDPANGNLKSVFILRKGEKKLIDQRAKGSLAPRFEYLKRKDSEGEALDPLGFLHFDLVEGTEVKDLDQVESFQVTGNDIQYFEEEKKAEEEVKEEKEEFVCKECDKSFSSKRALHAHSLSHNKKK